MTRNITPAIYYVYYYLRSKDSEYGKIGTPYYVGKGKNNRIDSKSKHESINLPAPQCRIKISENLTEEQALAIEKLHIRLWGRIDKSTGILRNRTDGGEGLSGYITSPETRAKRSLAAKASNARPEVQEKRRKTNATVEVSNKRRESAKRTWANPDVRARKIESLRLTNSLPTTRDKRSSGNKESWAATREQRVIACTAANKREDTRKKRSESGKIAQNRPEVKKKHAEINAKPEIRKKKSEAAKKAVAEKIDNGTHHWLGGAVTRAQLANGTHSSQILVTCPHCRKTGGKSGMMAQHFDKCKHR